MNTKNNNIPYINNKDKLILFDGICKLCNAWCRFIIRYDKNHIFKLASMQSEKGQAILKNLELPTEHFETMLYIEHNIIYEKSNAFIKIVKHLPLPIKLLFLLKIIPGLFRDFIYDRIALNRYKMFGEYNKCTLPTDDDNRYL
ncbi:MAG: thiol-disulfide oxidoreductase DCC family protein [Gammaproteobacteria bacterium]|nr:thiol-disulfide oxidoreductase DCC family protein [Gammaproteobacteria bacterium]